MRKNQKERKNPNRKFATGAIILALVTLVAYVRTLCPTVFVGDSGELIAASWTMGIPHSPGYPLYTFIGYFFSHLPIADNPAVRMNFMTALFGVLSVIVLFRLISIICGEYLFSFFASLIFAFSLTVWSQSVTAEVYTLNNLIVCLAVLYIILASMHEKKSYLYLASFFSGLALTTHQTSLLILPASIWLLIKTKRLPIKGAALTWIKTFVFYILGIAFYIYLPIAASRNPAMNWGNPSTFRNFMQMVFAPAFTQVNEGSFFNHLLYLIQIIFRELNPIGAILALIGIWVASKKSSNLQIKAVTWIVLTYIIFFLMTLRPISINLYKLDVYYLPVIMLLTILTVKGASYIFEYIERRKAIPTAILMSIIGIVLVIASVWSLTGNYNKVDKSDNRLAEWYGTELLESCDRDSILLCNFDDLFILFYLQKVMEIRPDIKVVLVHFPVRGEKAFWKKWLYDELIRDVNIKTGKTENLFFKSSKVEDVIETFIDENIQSRPVFISFYNIPPLEFKEMDYRFEPFKFCYRASKEGQNIEVLDSNYEYFQNNFREEFFNDLFSEHHNVEEDFILVRCNDIFRFNAALFYELNDLQKSLYFMKLSTAVNPLAPENWAFKARIEEALGDIDASLGSIEKIIQYEMNFTQDINTRIIDWRYEQAKILHKAGRNLEAADILNQYYKLDPRKLESIKDLAKEIESALADQNNQM